jgi:hypothetical protein
MKPELSGDLLLERQRSRSTTASINGAIAAQVLQQLIEAPGSLSS